MRIAQELVEAFHEKMSYPVADTPTLVDLTLVEQRYNFIGEELEEYFDAAEQDDLPGIADAIADLLYVVLGTAAVHGIDMQPIFEEVHRSNMTKTPLDPVTKKGGKGLGYEPPRIAPLLLQQAASFRDLDPTGEKNLPACDRWPDGAPT